MAGGCAEGTAPCGEPPHAAPGPQPSPVTARGLGEEPKVSPLAPTAAKRKVTGAGRRRRGEGRPPSSAPPFPPQPRVRGGPGARSQHRAAPPRPTPAAPRPSPPPQTLHSAPRPGDSPPSPPTPPPPPAAPRSPHLRRGAALPGGRGNGSRRRRLLPPRRRGAGREGEGAQGGRWVPRSPLSHGSGAPLALAALTAAPPCGRLGRDPPSPARRLLPPPSWLGGGVAGADS